MVTTTQALTATSTGTGTAKTTLNSGNDFVVPDPTKEIISFTPYLIPSGALTLDQPVSQRIEFESNDLNLQPKDLPWFALGVIDGTGQTPMHPVFSTFDLNAKTNGGENITISGRSLGQLNTAAMLLGIQITQSTGRTGRPEKYWFNSGATTALGTAAATVTGSTYRINNTRMITDVLGYATTTTATVSLTAGGEITLASPDFNTSLPVSFPIMPQISPLAADWAAQNTKMSHFKVAIPTRPNVAITESIAVAVALSGNGTWMSGVGFLR